MNFQMKDTVPDRGWGLEWPWPEAVASETLNKCTGTFFQSLPVFCHHGCETVIFQLEKEFQNALLVNGL